MTGHPFSKTVKCDLAISGWVYNGAGCTPVHRVANGKYLRRYRSGWTNSPTKIADERVFPTKAAADEARRAELERRS